MRPITFPGSTAEVFADDQVNDGRELRLQKGSNSNRGERLRCNVRCLQRVARRIAGGEVKALADDQRFRHLLAACIASMAHNPRDPHRAIGNAL